MKDAEKLLSVRDLVVEYTSGGQVIHAVNGVSFDLEKGKTLGLVGETGAGKTTIVKSIMRILPDPPAKIRQGEIIYNGENVLDMNHEQLQALRGKKISMIFQDPMTALNPVARIGDQIAEGIEFHYKVSRHEADERARKILNMVGIPEERFREYPHQFSGGMKQRVIIAIALSCEPELLLADEPTTALDVTIQAQILDMIKRLITRNNMSMILVTHDLGIVAENCDNVAVVYSGEIIEYGSLEEIFDQPAHPYTLGLFRSIPDMTHHVRRLTPIVGMPTDPTNLPAGCKFRPRCPYATEECKNENIPSVNLGGTHVCKCCNILGYAESEGIKCRH